MKYIFLDIDGVLNCSHDFRTLKPITPRVLGSIVCPQKKERFLKLKKESGATVILSSTWRLYPELCNALNSIGITWTYKTLQNINRGAEIQQFVDENGLKDFIIIDDDQSIQRYPDLVPRWIETSFMSGFLEEHLEAARDLFQIRSTK